jgi:hypothetical protein
MVAIGHRYRQRCREDLLLIVLLVLLLRISNVFGWDYDYDYDYEEEDEGRLRGLSGGLDRAGADVHPSGKDPDQRPRLARFNLVILDTFLQRLFHVTRQVGT